MIYYFTLLVLSIIYLYFKVHLIIPHINTLHLEPRLAVRGKQNHYDRKQEFY